MKHVKFMMPMLAFVMAATLAFATSKTEEVALSGQAHGPFTEGCVLGDLQQENCSENNDGNICTVIKYEGTPAQEIEDAHTDNTCSVLLRQPKQ